MGSTAHYNDVKCSLRLTCLQWVCSTPSHSLNKGTCQILCRGNPKAQGGKFVYYFRMYLSIVCGLGCEREGEGGAGVGWEVRDRCCNISVLHSAFFKK